MEPEKSMRWRFVACRPSGWTETCTMSFLGGRIQEMVDTAPDPEEAISAFQEAMFCGPARRSGPLPNG